MFDTIETTHAPYHIQFIHLSRINDIIILFREKATYNGKNFAKSLGCFDGDQWDANVAEECMRSKTNAELYSAYMEGTFRSKGNVDNFSKFEPILPELPDELLGNGSFNKVLV